VYEFVGRASELARLRARLDDARAGGGQLVLLTGEPGIGKTRLAEELGRHAEASGMRRAWARASEDTGSPPYWIFRQLIRSAGRAVPDLLAGRVAAGEPAQARFEAFEAVAEQLRADAEPDGLLMVLDDLQWADAASLALLVHLARGIGRSPTMILATYRDTDITGREALSVTLSALAHEPSLTRLRLVGLTQPEVERQLAAVTGAPVSPELAGLVRRRSGGNPFFVAELGRMLDTAGEGLPDAVVDALRSRLARLSGSCRALIATAAALGDTLDPVGLAEVSERPIVEVLADLDEAAAAGIVTGPDGWRFGHDLVRQTARLNLPTAIRLGAHARLAAFLQSRPDASARVAEIAHHWLESLPVGDPAQASDWAERAADEALEQLAWERASALYRQAHDAGAPLTASRRSRLLRGAAVAHLRGGEINLGTATLTDAADAAREAGDPAELGEIALAAESLTDWESFHRGSRSALAEEALAALPCGDHPLRARLLALQATLGIFGGAEPEHLSAEALAMAERLQDGQVLRSALRARQMVRSPPDGVHERLELGNRMLALGTADNDDDTALWGRLWRFDALAMLGRLDHAEAELRPMRVLAERGRRPIARWHYLRNQAAIDIARGRFEDAITALRHCLTLVEGRAREHAALLGIPITVLSIVAGLTGRADVITDQMLKVFDVIDRGAPHFIGAILAKSWLRLGDPERAFRYYSGGIAPDQPPVTSLLIACAAYVEISAELGQPEHASTAAAALRRHPDLFVTGGAGAQVITGSVRTYLGIASAAAGRLDDAVRELRLGIEANDRADAPPFAALARFELARVLARRRRHRDVDEAEALAAAVADTAEGLGMAPLRRDADELAASLRGHAPGPLTDREREVAAHVGQGLTNKQIATLMYISVRTAETHVQHILTKLGLPNRTHIAAWVRDGVRIDRP
jgi:DNA-binding CsgD family transcriptional regulator/tetratricopeptide (TPR) repeat protein